MVNFVAKLMDMENSFKSIIAGERIEYIDAMRGFTMLLVVCSHVQAFMIGNPVYSLNDLFGQFRMPLFFFVSGLVFYKANCHWGIDEMRTLFKKKITVQVLSPLLFMLIHCYWGGLGFVDALCDPFKIGYWFTFVLFEFFVLYVLIHRLMDFLPINGHVKDCMWISIGLVIYALSALGNRYLPEMAAGLFSVGKLLYFLYFVVGAMVRKHWGYFQQLLDHGTAITLFIVTFVVLNLFGDAIHGLPLGGVGCTLLSALSGLFLVFAFFRCHACSVSHETVLGRTLQYIGKHTLDIYLLHYFFLESYTTAGLINFSGTAMNLLQFVLCLMLSSMIIAGCLIVSSVVRMSPFLGLYLFGAKPIS